MLSKGFLKGSISREDPQMRQKMIRLLQPIVFGASRVGLFHYTLTLITDFLSCSIQSSAYQRMSLILTKPLMGRFYAQSNVKSNTLGQSKEKHGSHQVLFSRHYYTLQR